MRRAAVTLAIVLCVQSASAQTTGYTLARKPRMGLVLSGAGLLVGGLVASIVTAAADGFGGVSPYVLIPFAGPFIGFGWDRANPNACSLDVDTSGCNSVLVDVGLVAVGLVESTGAALLAVGLVPHEVRTKVTVTPSFTWRRGPVFGVAGTF